MLLVSLSHDAKAKSMRVREIQYLCFCFSDLCVSEPTLQVLNECFEEGVVSEPLKDGKLSYWLNSYVNSVVTQDLNSDKVAA